MHEHELVCDEPATFEMGACVCARAHLNIYEAIAITVTVITHIAPRRMEITTIRHVAPFGPGECGELPPSHACALHAHALRTPAGECACARKHVRAYLLQHIIQIVHNVRGMCSTAHVPPRHAIRCICVCVCVLCAIISVHRNYAQNM